MEEEKISVLVVLPKSYASENSNGIAKIYFNAIKNNINLNIIEVFPEEVLNPWGKTVLKILSFFLPREEAFFYFSRRKMARKIESFLGDVDVVHLFSGGSAFLLPFLSKRVRVKTFVSLIDNKIIYIDRELEKAKLSSRIFLYLKKLRVLICYKIIASYNPIISFVAPLDAAKFHKDFKVASHVIKNGVDIRVENSIRKNQVGNAIYFHGDFTYEPNADAADFIARLAHRNKNRINFQFILIGKGSEKYDSELIRGLGFVDKIENHLRYGEIYFAPLRIGSGIKNKILEAAAIGMQIVTTTVGNDGINLKEGEMVNIIDLDDEEKIIRVLNDLTRVPVNFEKVDSVKKYIADEFSWERCSDEYLQIYKSVQGG